MTIVSSGPISMSAIGAEEGLAGTNISLTAASTNINPISPIKPDGIIPHAMSEFYSYNHGSFTTTTTTLATTTTTTLAPTSTTTTTTLGTTTTTTLPTTTTTTLPTTTTTTIAVTYNVSPNTTTVNEGQAVTFTVTTTGVPDGTTLFWTNAGTTDANDFTDFNDYGSFQIFSNTATIVRTLRNDLSTEGTETILFKVRTGSISGTVRANAATVNVTDTSVQTTTTTTLPTTTTTTLPTTTTTSSTTTTTTYDPGAPISITYSYEASADPSCNYLSSYNRLVIVVNGTGYPVTSGSPGTESGTFTAVPVYAGDTVYATTTWKNSTFCAACGGGPAITEVSSWTASTVFQANCNSPVFDYAISTTTRVVTAPTDTIDYTSGPS